MDMTKDQIPFASFYLCWRWTALWMQNVGLLCMKFVAWNVSSFCVSVQLYDCIVLQWIKLFLLSFQFSILQGLTKSIWFCPQCTLQLLAAHCFYSTGGFLQNCTWPQQDWCVLRPCIDHISAARCAQLHTMSSGGGDVVYCTPLQA